MRYSQCKCGKRTCWHSGMPEPACRICTKCGTTLAEGPEWHDEPEPHDYIWQYNQNTGKPDHLYCQRCYDSYSPPELEDYTEWENLPDPADWNTKDMEQYALNKEHKDVEA